MEKVLEVISAIAFELFIALLAVAGAVATGTVIAMLIIFLYDLVKEHWYER